MVDLTLSEPSLGGLGFVSLVKTNLFKNGYFLRSCSKVKPIGVKVFDPDSSKVSSSCND